MSRLHHRFRTRALGAVAALTLITGLPLAAAPASAQQMPGSSSGSSDMLPDLGKLNPREWLPGNDEPNESLDMSLSKDTGLSDGEKITVTGTGYRPGDGVYITQTIERPSSGYPQTYGEAVKVTPDDSGSFRTELPVDVVFGETDCREVKCYVASFTAFPNLVDRSQDVWKPISFAAGATPSSPAGNGGGNAGNSGGGTTGGSGGATSSSGASVSVSPTTDLSPSGQTVQVSGRGFKTSGNGIYVGIAAMDNFSPTNQDAFGPDTTWLSRNNGKLNSDGSFSISLPVQAKFGSTDCMKTQCAIYTLAAHGSSDRSQDTATPVGFKGGVAPAASGGSPTVSGSTGGGTSGGNYSNTGSAATSDSDSSGSTNGNISVTANPTTIKASGKTAVTVSGTGFATTGPGIYVGVAEKSKFSHVDATVFGDTKFIRTSEMSANGAWSTTLNIEAVFPAGNCIDNQCAIFTFAAHGSSDRSQDAAVDITVAGTKAEKDAARKRAAEEEKKAADKDRKRGSIDSDGAEDVDIAQANSVSGMTAFWIGLLGALVGGAIVGLVAWLLGRKKHNDTDTADEDI
ncbi:hypothetical protein KRX51_07850 [Corynebacterium sp. TAE3-ERU12]|uniref:neocarzinostatin apoprotein domain-containing protein n=1 Tax=Corynebacterium sp. TAE3-ERU12 TaxID=2849491 RepID=UPI001C46ADC9|nr:neocarzinostatin apoprotein domain-containing protein [Corynebacterium sp. TAE3-ERU12]MBV7295824.1 hypothetical protein [Corynebacterium sp. TAE3-ERU12]